VNFKIALLHISKRRPIQAFKIFQEWENNAKDPENIGYVLSLNKDDSTVDAYIANFVPAKKRFKFIMNISNSCNGVQALNSAADAAFPISPDIELLVSLSDDQGCPKYWDEELLKCLDGIDNFKQPIFIGVSDGIRPYGQLFPYYIANRAYYEKFGYVLYPEYDGVFADNDMTEVAKKVGLCNASHLMFEHRHWSVGKSERDEISNQNDIKYNPKGWDRNYKIYQERSKRNFDL